MTGLNYRDPRPMYQQIKDNFKRLILSGAMAPGEKLPSVRELASQLAINPNTIQRAYRELESEGFIYTVPGKGCFADKKQEANQVKKEQLLRDFDRLVIQLGLMGVGFDELIKRLSEGGSGSDRDK